jgi:hypothetical protein
MSNLIDAIAEKAAMLPPEQQREALAFIESLAGAGEKRFRSVRGVLQMNLEKFDADLASVRRQMWRNFPRAEPK